ncbi:vitamin K epoxide reductase family protein [Hoyosella rhizosphaerae]|uniref:Vitamin K epoxide reductase domain-containing protein n=1 Tax=Hoyosella rhizosphaerae TaxID=1755582 RepID=A0A916U7A8_9ACTN|nr:vitamin K epoxide reductase family protein [Hoyosella rhizosphaerae]MBN4927718.1 vitamin K epoxide reductase family protein [Hoyosella rhizosphaerae]GGC62146.1 hypothetical protein GCM10011410_13250 [Hoyosella rhizosphaerae]
MTPTLPSTDPVVAPRRAATGWALLILGVVGLAAAAALTYERFLLLLDPTHVPSCSINPVLSCGSVMESPQASLFGFPNPLLGLVAFTVVVTTAIVVLAGSVLPRWYWLGLAAGSTLGLIFVHWLIFHSLYTINALCPYCMVVWVVQLPITVVAMSAAFPNARNYRGVAWLVAWRWNLVALWYVAVLLLILERFWYYWSTLV